MNLIRKRTLRPPSIIGIDTQIIRQPITKLLDRINAFVIASIRSTEIISLKRHCAKRDRFPVNNSAFGESQSLVPMISVPGKNNFLIRFPSAPTLHKWPENDSLLVSDSGNISISLHEKPSAFKECSLKVSVDLWGWEVLLHDWHQKK